MSSAELWKELAIRSHSAVLQDAFQSLRGQRQLVPSDAALWRRLWAVLRGLALVPWRKARTITR